MKVAIIGRGIVGKAQQRLFAGHDVVSYDITDGEAYPTEKIGASDFAIICVGTPSLSDGSCDLTSVLKSVDEMPDGVPILIRSTITPGTLDGLQEDYPDNLIAHAPDFLHERVGGQWPDSADVPYMLLGGLPEAHAFFLPYIKQVFPGKVHLCSGLVSEMAKYVGNLYWATRVTFVNEMGAICNTYGADWDEVRAAWLADERVNPAYTKLHGFPPGFGGRCWPKDLSALITDSHLNGYTPEFLEDVEDANFRFTGKEVHES